MNEIRKVLFQQRIRNGIIEYFDGAASFEEIAKFGAFEWINMWEDIVPEPFDVDFYSEPVFSRHELAAIEIFRSIWSDTSDATPEDVFAAHKLSQSRHWKKFVGTAKSNFDLFMQRGKFSNEKVAF